MAIALESLIGKTVLDASPIEAGVRMLFDNGATLISFNKTTIASDYIINYDELSNSKLIYTEESEDYIKLYFGESTYIIISLRNEDCTGPEYLELIMPDQQRVVWN